MKKTKITVLGGGIASLASIFELTKNPAWKKEYDITLYQLGYRLGGKGASGRNLEKHNRIEEHGPHSFWGFYDNLFKLMKECYEELIIRELRDKDDKFATFESTISPGGTFYTCKESDDGEFIPTIFDGPSNSTKPGVHRKFTVTQQSELIVNWLVYLNQKVWKNLGKKGGVSELMRSFRVISIVMRGVYNDRNIIKRSWESLDDEDFFEWLKRHGASDALIKNGMSRYPYFLVLSGDTTIPAGTVLKGLFASMFSYKGEYAWKLNAGMGEIVFTPLYQVLSDRGIKFKFFHRIESLQLTKDSTQIGKILLSNQLPQLTKAYEPLIDVDGIPCWPIFPKWDWLKDQGVKLTKAEKTYNYESFEPGPFDEKVTLNKGKDFDLVLLGISIGALPTICKELIEKNSRFKKMVDSSDAVSISSAQLWFNQSMSEMGWKGETFNMLVGNGIYKGVPGEHLYDTFSDFTQIIPSENWEEDPKNCTYLSGRTNLKVSPKGQVEELFEMGGVKHIIPNIYKDKGEINWDVLSSDATTKGKKRLDDQFFTKSPNPSDYYVRTPTESTEHRLYPHESGFDNLVLCGDWVKTRLSLGCVEAATMSGLQATIALHNKLHGNDINQFSLIVGPLRNNGPIARLFQSI